MPGGVAYLLQVVVLAPRPYAFLRGHRAAVIAVLQSLECAFELNHTSIGEQQRGIVGGNQRGRRHMGMAVALEEIHERRANLGRFHGWKLTGLNHLRRDPSQPTIASAILRYARD